MPERYIPEDIINPVEHSAEDKKPEKKKSLKQLVGEAVPKYEFGKGDKLTPQEIKEVETECRKTLKDMDDAEKKESRYGSFKEWYKSEMEGGKRGFSKVYGLGRRLFDKVVFKLLKTNIEVNGKENFSDIPKDKGFLIVAPHMCQLDPQLLMTQLPKERQLSFMSGQVCNFKGGVKGLMEKILLKCGAIPVMEPRRKDFKDSSEHSWEFGDSSVSTREYFDLVQKSNDVAAKRIKDGGVVATFPEGPIMNRGQKELRQSTTSSVRIIEALEKMGMGQKDITILPIGIEDSSSIIDNPIGTSLQDVHRNGHARINIGKSFSYSDVVNAVEGKNLQARADYIMGRVAELMPEDLRGPYRKNIFEHENTSYEPAA